MKIFLTGATGFIGSHVARLLVREGCTVYALLRPESNPWRIHDILPSLRIIRGDLTHPNTNLFTDLKEIRPELAVHLAWYAVPHEYLNHTANIELLQASLTLAKHLASLGCQKMIAAGTCFEYDTAAGYLSEKSPTKPKSLYAASKLACHLVFEQYAQLTKMPMVWLRFFYQYGPFEDERRLVPTAILSLLRGEAVKTPPGNLIRDFLHVEDVASAVWEAAKSNLTGTVNIGSGKPVSVQEIVAHIGKILNKPQLIDGGSLPFNPDDPPFICANNAKLRENTSWTPQFNLDQGLRHTIQWWKNKMNEHVGIQG